MKTNLPTSWGWLSLLLLIASLPLRAQNLNLAYGKTVTTSSVQSADYKAENATDGNCNTRWSSEFADSQYLVIDLGTVQTIDRVRLTWEAAYGDSFSLQVSSNPSDDKAWTTVKSVTSNNPVDRGGYFLNEFSNLNHDGTSIGRYVRLVGSARKTVYGYSIFEFEVFGFSNTAVSLAASKTGVASDTQDAYSGSMAFDGDDYTRWSTLNTNNQTLDVDLGQNVTISRIYLNWEKAYGVDFVLQSSPDQNTWTTFANFSNNQAYYNEQAVAASGRYVRMLGMNGGKNNGGFSIWELKIYGSPAPLPVILASFSAKPRGTGVAVNWTTASEQNNAGFEVQRSADGVQFASITKVAGAGTSQQTHAYSYLDAAPLRAKSYYRLKQIDLDGRQTYGPVVAVELAGAVAASLSIYPNPTADQATAQWNAAAAGAGRWQLATTTGQVVHQASFAVQPGNNSQAIDLRQVPAGSYVLTLEADGQTLRRQLVQKVQ
jgi:hypothetical protein